MNICSTFLHLIQPLEIKEFIRSPVSPCVSHRNILLTTKDRGSAASGILYFTRTFKFNFCPFLYSFMHLFHNLCLLSTLSSLSTLFFPLPSHSIFVLFSETCALFPSPTSVLVSVLLSRQSSQGSIKIQSYHCANGFQIKQTMLFIPHKHSRDRLLVRFLTICTIYSGAILTSVKTCDNSFSSLT